MKPIQRLSAPTAGLDAYRLEESDEARNWDGFKSHEAGASYKELVETLVAIQHGLCGYCEIDIKERDRQVEHVVPQSDPHEGAKRTLDQTNMIACCKGGTLLTDDDERRLDPVRNNRSCGEAKENLVDDKFIDPRTLPALPSLLQVNFEGRIEADKDSCDACGIAAAKVQKTIDILRLNTERLRRARENRWKALNENWESHFGDLAVMRAAARGELLPGADGRLEKFFTTSRAYFSPISEDLLEEGPRKWI